MLQPSAFRIFFISLIALLGFLFSVPNIPALRGFLPNFIPNTPVTLGLDLQGGAFFRVKVDTSKVLEDYYNGLYDLIRERMREERLRIGRPLINNGALYVRISDASTASKAFDLIKPLDRNAQMSLNDTQIEIRLPDDELNARKERVVTQSVEVVRRRVDGSGLTEPSIKRQGSERIELQLPGVSQNDLERIKDNISKGGRLEFRAVSENPADASNRLDFEIVSGDPAQGEGDLQYTLERRVVISGDMVEDASFGYDQNNQPAVHFRLDAKGAKRFSDHTRQNISKRFAIVLDGKAVSAPVIQSHIPGGQGQITGNFTASSANQLALLIRAGALPASLIFLEERSVGPTLGQDSITAGFAACLIGLALVMLFMLLYYGLFGIFANIALLVNLVLVLGVLTLLPATLTLPGIAGIVLTVGMAVDANVLVFERIREVFAKRPNLAKALTEGFDEAVKTILDANLTTLIAALVLYYFGSGPVKGFAVTLGIGILCSMFAALLFTRMLLGLWWNPKRNHLPIAL